jgi:very-short-patch-repair endonuclease
MKFRRQCPIGKYVVDFYCFEAALAIELDGSIHSQPSQLRKDAAKDLFLKRRGIRVLRVPNGLVAYPEDFVKKVREALTHPFGVPPLPKGEGSV